MKQNEITFDTEKLVVHWLEFSIEGLYDLEEIKKKVTDIATMGKILDHQFIILTQLVKL